MIKSTDSLFAQVLTVDNLRYKAMTERDLITLETVLDDALLYTHSSAVTDTKETYLKSLRTGATLYQNIIRSDEMFTASNGVVLMVGHVLIAGTACGTPMLIENRFTTAWARRNDQWKLLTWASTPVRNPPTKS
jgi:hypothetical protein